MKYRKVHKGMMFVEQPLLDAIDLKIFSYKHIYDESDDDMLKEYLEDWIKYLGKCLEKFKAKMTAGDEL